MMMGIHSEVWELLPHVGVVEAKDQVKHFSLMGVYTFYFLLKIKQAFSPASLLTASV